MNKLQFRPIVVDELGQEVMGMNADGFPTSMDAQLVDKEGCAGIPHWHYELQISVVTQGTVTFRTAQGDVLLHQGEGIFINRGILHEILKTEDEDGAYICANFRPEMIYGDAGSVIRKEYVDPIIFNSSMQSIPLNKNAWHKKICELVLGLQRLYEVRAFGYELEVKIVLCQIWYLLLKYNEDLLKETTVINFSDRKRVEAMQSYIHENYMEKITLKDIASAAQISRSECCRAFKRVQHIQPMSYLMQYRIAQSLKMLTCSEANISEIAQQMGFSSSSYYTECFKQEMQCTPIQYRKQYVLRKQGKES